LGTLPQSVNVGWVWRAAEAALDKPSPDVGVRETQEPHSLTETFFKEPACRALRFGAITQLS
jgi:hypothetical protein